MSIAPQNSVFPITRAAGFGSLPHLITEWESERALHKAFHAEGIPLSAIDDPSLYVPQPAMVGVFEHAARSAGRRDFGLHVGQRMRFHTFGLWVQYCAQAPTLNEGMARARKTLQFHQNCAHFSLEREGNYALWRYRPRFKFEKNTQHADHLIFPLLHSIQAFLGHSWRPAWFELNYPRDAEAHIIEEALPAPVRFGQSAIGVALPLACLYQKGPGALCNPITFQDVQATETLPYLQDPLRTIMAMATLRLRDGKTDIDGIAHMVGVGVRTLQRYLGSDGMSYRDLLAAVRSKRAMELLRDTDMTITEIALSLGYSEHANFTRAFTRWTGKSPLQYRRERLGY
ncbi:transcriptional regulator, AraC family [Methyloceanibacter caenitepidi]|uniref:Transcriptional regulator, AraC family n=1 Tax=Methyloceanibacter caenitepidi TaxID=1384459 RepID=A0A0A8K7A8_9HYPH|nr:transcriptional regulator, AraC family [Methyloceanibacter caenitepidi]